MREWRAKNRERAREISRAGNAKYIKAHPEKRAETLRKYKENTMAADLGGYRKRCTEAARKFREKHPDKIKAATQKRVERIRSDAEYRERINANHRAWYAKHVIENPEYLERKSEAAKRYAQAHPDKWREQRNAANARWRATHPTALRTLRRTKREKILDFFGGKCCLCGFSEPAALHMDHINGGGGKERKQGGGTIREQYNLITTNPDAARAKYQLLCANCHCRKGR